MITRLAVPDDSWEFGQPMRLHVVELGVSVDGESVSTWEFTP